MRPWTLLHACLAIVTVGLAVHNGILAAAALAGRPGRPGLQRRYARWLPWAYVATFALGLWVYPPWRVDVRAAFLDVQHPWLTALFEVKEHALALGLLVLAWYVPATRARESAGGPTARLYHAAGLYLAAAVLLGVAGGLLATMARPA